MFGEFSVLLLNMSVGHIKTVVVCVIMMVRKSVSYSESSSEVLRASVLVNYFVRLFE
jgi:hypothetical protein